MGMLLTQNLVIQTTGFSAETDSVACPLFKLPYLPVILQFKFLKS